MISTMGTVPMVQHKSRFMLNIHTNVEPWGQSPWLNILFSIQLCVQMVFGLRIRRAAP